MSFLRVGKIISLPTLFVFFVAGCVTPGHLIKESSHSMADIRSAILYVIGKPRKISSNEREYTSDYFSRQKGSKQDLSKAKERLYARITILGDRRPYDIGVQAVVEERDDEDGTYDEVDVDDDFSDRIANEIKLQLSRSRDDRNLIDDFRAF